MIDIIGILASIICSFGVYLLYLSLSNNFGLWGIEIGIFGVCIAMYSFVSYVKDRGIFSVTFWRKKIHE